MQGIHAITLSAALVACGDEPPPRTWLDLLAPLAPGEEVLPGWTLQAPRRGFEHDIVLDVVGPDGQKAEVHVVDAGRWPEALPAGPYGVDWEGPRTTAPKEVADALTRAVADAVRARAHGQPAVDDVPLGTEPAGPLDPVLRALGALGTRRMLPGAGLAALLLGWWAALTSAAPPPTARRDALVLGVVALGLRLALGSFGPLHANGQGDLWVAGARDPQLLSHYGPGYPELWGLIARAHPPERVIELGNAMLSALTAAAAVLLGHRLGLTRERAALAGLLLAADPVSIRAAATESYLVPAALLPLLAAQAGLRGDRRGLVAVAALAALAARLHPTAWLPLALAPLLAPGHRAATAAAAAVGAVATSGAVLSDVLRAVEDGRLSSPAAAPDPAAAGLAVLLTAGVALRHRALAPAVAAAAIADLLLRASYAQSDLWQAAFDRLWTPALALGLAAITPPAVRPPALFALAAVALAAGRGTLVHRTTDDHERRVARTWLDATPPGCAVLYVTRTDAVVTVHLPVPPPGVRAVPIDARGPVDLAPLLADGCARYLRTSACGTRTGAAACARVEADLTLTSLETAPVPAIPSHRDVSYPTDPIVLSLHDVAPRRDPTEP